MTAALSFRVVLAALLLALLTACGETRVGPAETPAPAATETMLPATPVPEPTATATATPVPPPPTVTPVAASTSPATPLFRGPAANRVVALTFDAGADRGFAELILDILLRENVKVAFGMTGQWAHQHGDLVRRMAAEGHIFINHSYSHGSFTGASTSSRPMTREQRFSELDRTEEVVRSLTGLTTRPFFRPPYGDYDASVNTDVGLRGYSVNVLWTIDSRGWMGLPAAEIVDRCLKLAEPGAIYIFHVGAASQDAQALPAIIHGLRELGYDFVQFSAFVRQ